MSLVPPGQDGVTATPGLSGWRPQLVPPRLASAVLAGFIISANPYFQGLVDTLGRPDYAVPPPVTPVPAPPLQPSNEKDTFSGLLADAHFSSNAVLLGHSVAWQGLEGTTVEAAENAASVGSEALQAIRRTVDRVQSVLDAADLNRTVAVTYPAGSDGPGEAPAFASYLEYRLALAVDGGLFEAELTVWNAQRALGLTPLELSLPPLPRIPSTILPPHPIPIPQPRDPWSPASQDPRLMQT